MTSTTADPDTSNNEAATIDVIDFTSNVVLTKVAPSPAPVPGGAPGRWTITLVNNGPSTANDVVISDAITTSTPVVDVVLGSAGTVGACDTDVTCTIGDLPPGTTVTVLIDVEYPADATPGLVTNTATVTGNNLTGTTSADADFVLLGTADLVITKEVLPDSNVLAGVSATYRIRVENIGPSDAEMVEINDLLPAAALDPVTTAPGCVASAGDLTCLIGTLAAGAAFVVDVDFTADPGAVAGDLDNTAIVISSTDDPNAANNTATVTTGVSSVADLRPIKSVSAGPYVAGAATTHTYQVQIDNAGPSTATGVTVTDSVPAGLTISGPVVYSVGALSGSCSVVGNDVSCPLTDLPPGVDVASVQIPVTIDSDTPAGPIINAAVVTAATADPSADNNTDTASLTVVRTTTVTLAKSGVANGPAGTTATWTITGTVDGPSSAEASTVSDTLPIGFTPTSATGTSSNGPVSCTISGRLLSCPLGDLLPGASFEITVDTTIAATVAAGVYPNTANFSTITPNGSTSAQGPVTIERNAPLVVTKATVGTGPFTAGEPLDWTIVVTNPGPSTSENVVVEELVPVGYTVASLATTSGSCTTTTCTLGNLPVGGTATITVRGTVDADTPAASMTNTVEVTSDTPGAPPPVEKPPPPQLLFEITAPLATA